MKEKAMLLMVGAFSIGTVVLAALRIMSIEVFSPIAVMVISYGVQELRLTNNDKSWGGWTEDQAKKDDARYGALVAMFEQVMARFQTTIDKTATKAAEAAVEKGSE